MCFVYDLRVSSTLIGGSAHIGLHLPERGAFVLKRVVFGGRFIEYIIHGWILKEEVYLYIQHLS